MPTSFAIHGSRFVVSVSIDNIDVFFKNNNISYVPISVSAMGAVYYMVSDKFETF